MVGRGSLTGGAWWAFLLLLAGVLLAAAATAADAHSWKDCDGRCIGKYSSKEPWKIPGCVWDCHFSVLQADGDGDDDREQCRKMCLQPKKYSYWGASERLQCMQQCMHGRARDDDDADDKNRHGGDDWCEKHYCQRYRDHDRRQQCMHSCRGTILEVV